MGALALTLLMAACGGGSGGTTPVTSSAPAAPEPSVASVEGSYLVDGYGGHALYLSCRGTGSPTVVYLHDSVAADAQAAPRKAGAAFAAIVEDHQRVCLYDRRGVGDSDRVTGPQTPADALADLAGLLKKADVGGPYVLVGSGFGGLLAYLYANQHRKAVTGLVLLDSLFPEELDADQLLPAAERFSTSSARDEADTPEAISRYKALQAAHRYKGHEPKIPLVYLTAAKQPITDPARPDGWNELVVQLRADFVARFHPGTLTEVDAARPLEGTAPRQVADAVAQVSD